VSLPPTTLRAELLTMAEAIPTADNCPGGLLLGVIPSVVVLPLLVLLLLFWTVNVWRPD